MTELETTLEALVSAVRRRGVAAQQVQNLRRALAAAETVLVDDMTEVRRLE